MKATELRIGNLLQDYLETRTVAELHKDCYTDTNGMSTLYRDADGIELTEEWLLKFGFKVERPYAEKEFYYIVLDENEFYGLLFEPQDEDNNEEGFRLLLNCREYETETRIRYVHQLQNLYFALTGEELEIKK